MNNNLKIWMLRDIFAKILSQITNRGGHFMLLSVHNAVIDAFSSRKPSTILFVSIFLLLLLGGVDYFTGDYSLIVFYLIPVSLTAWFVSKNCGIFFCCLVILVRFAADEFSSSLLFHNTSLHYWNEGIELAFLLIMSFLFSALRKNLDSEKNLASTDPLTGMLNRRSFFSLAGYELNRSRRYGLPFTVAYIDLDNFKYINDQFGHHVGDKLLVSVTRTIVGNIRSTDIIARFGGDEFVLMLPETPSSPALTLIEKLHRQLQSDMDAKHWNVTFSIGAITYLTPPATADEMVRRADRQMYEVKHGGKNRLLHTEIKESV